MKILMIGLLVGAAAGLAGALCGVGGGILMVPAFVLVLGMGQKHAVATSLAIVVVTAGWVFCFPSCPIPGIDLLHQEKEGGGRGKISGRN